MKIKTDWQVRIENEIYIGDFFNFSDYNRIRLNILEIYNLAIQLNPTIKLQEMRIYNSYLDFPHLKMYSSVENNIDIINKLTFNLDYTKRNFPETYPYNELIKPWNYNDLNRIESMIYMLFITLLDYIEKQTIYSIITEDGFNFITEDGKLIIKEF